MNTLITDSPEEAAGFLNRGELVAFPTETVYGLGADAFRPEAIAKIFRAKERPADNPLIIHVHSIEQIEIVAASISEQAALLIDRFFPGPLTVVLEKKPSIPDLVTGGLQTVGVRCPAHPLANSFLRCCSHPVAAPSANVSGRPSSTDWKAVYHDLHGRISCILKGPAAPIGLESTIVDCSVEPPVLLRTGAVSLEALLELIPSLKIASGCSAEESPKSPGMKYRHYAPSASIILLPADPERFSPEPSAAFIGLTEPPGIFELVKQCRSPEEYAHELFGFFRSCDARGIKSIYCELPKEKGIGRAILDRLTRAACPR